MSFGYTGGVQAELLLHTAVQPSELPTPLSFLRTIQVITKDTVQIVIDALVYFRVSDPRLGVFNIQNLPDSVELLTQATLRNIVAKMTLDETFSSRDKINSDLLLSIRPDAERWGVTVTRVEIFNIDPPRDIRNAMEQQVDFVVLFSLSDLLR